MGDLIMMDDQGRYFPSHLSASQFQLYRLCPLLYRERYVLNLFPPAQPERLFGVAVHAGLEAQFKGGDDEMVFLRTWTELLRSIDAKLYPLLPSLRSRGLELLEQVRGLGLRGQPERNVIVTAEHFRIPIIGFADLWDEAGTIYDFKTTGYGWPQSKADEQLFQPAIYSQAFADEHSLIPAFKFVVLPRIKAPLQILDATRSGDQIIAAFDVALRIHRAIENQEWGCTCRGKYHLFDPSGWNEFEEEIAS